MKNLITLLLFMVNFNSYGDCIQTMNIYGVWGKDDIFKDKLKQRNRNLVKALRNLETCELMFFQEAWSKTSDNILKKYDEKSVLRRLNNINSPEYNIGLTSLISSGVDRAVGHTFYRNAPGRDGWLRNLPFVKVKKGFNFFKMESGVGVINLHIQPINNFERASEVKATQISHALDIIKFIFDDKDNYTIPLAFVGDFNSAPGNSAFDLLIRVLSLKDSYLEANNRYGGACTYCKEDEDSPEDYLRVIDYILFKNGIDKKIIPSKVEINLASTRDNFISDHRGVRMSFSLEVTNSLKNNENADQKISQAINELKKVQKIIVKIEGFKREQKIIESLVNRLQSDSKLRTYYQSID